MKKCAHKFFGKLFHENGDPKFLGFVFIVTVSIASAFAIEGLVGLLMVNG